MKFYKNQDFLYKVSLIATSIITVASVIVAFYIIRMFVEKWDELTTFFIIFETLLVIYVITCATLNLFNMFMWYKSRKKRNIAVSNINKHDGNIQK